MFIIQGHCAISHLPDTQVQCQALDGVPEALLVTLGPLKLDFATVGTLVLPDGNDADDADQNQGEAAGRDAGVNAWAIGGRILGSEDQASSNTTNTAHADERS